MDYAVDLLVPILGGLFLGLWLERQFHAPFWWTPVLAVVGMVSGLGILYKRQMAALPAKRLPQKPPSKPSAEEDA